MDRQQAGGGVRKSGAVVSCQTPARREADVSKLRSTGICFKPVPAPDAREEDPGDLSPAMYEERKSVFGGREGGTGANLISPRPPAEAMSLAGGRDGRRGLLLLLLMLLPYPSPWTLDRRFLDGYKLMPEWRGRPLGDTNYLSCGGEADCATEAHSFPRSRSCTYTTRTETGRATQTTYGRRVTFPRCAQISVCVRLASPSLLTVPARCLGAYKVLSRNGTRPASGDDTAYRRAGHVRARPWSHARGAG